MECQLSRRRDRHTHVAKETPGIPTMRTFLKGSHYFVRPPDLLSFLLPRAAAVIACSRLLLYRSS